MQPSSNKGSLQSGLAEVSGCHLASSQGFLESRSTVRLILVESALAPTASSGPAHR